MATLTKKERAWLNELQEVLDRCPSPKKIGFYTIGDMNAGFDEKILFPSSVESTAG